MEEGELGGDTEGRNGEVELVEDAEGFLNGINNLVKVLLGVVGGGCGGVHIHGGS